MSRKCTGTDAMHKLYVTVGSQGFDLWEMPHRDKVEFNVAKAGTVRIHCETKECVLITINAKQRYPQPFQSTSRCCLHMAQGPVWTRRQPPLPVPAHATASALKQGLHSIQSPVSVSRT